MAMTYLIAVLLGMPMLGGGARVSSAHVRDVLERLDGKNISDVQITEHGQMANVTEVESMPPPPVNMAARKKSLVKEVKTQACIGPLCFSTNAEGCVRVDTNFKEPLKVGIESDNVQAYLGFGDIRDGFKVGAKACGRVSAYCEGNSVQELHDTIASDDHISKEVLDIAVKITTKILQAPDKLLGMIKESLEAVLKKEINVDVNIVSEVLSAKIEDPRYLFDDTHKSMALAVVFEIGASFNLEVKAGWLDTQGFYMVGAAGDFGAGVDFGGGVFVGVDQEQRHAKMVLHLGNFEFAYLLPLMTQTFPLLA